MSQFSYSKIKTWNECPKSYQLTYLEKVGKDEHDQMTLGSAAHEFFQIWVEKLLKEPTTEWENMALQSWAKEPRNQNLYQEYLSICKEFVKNLDINEIKTYEKTICELNVAIDKDFNPCDWNDENVYFRGKIDRLDINGNSARITDYKCSFRSNSDPFQGYCYAWLLTKIFPEIINYEVVIHYARSNWKETWRFTRDKLQGIEFQINSITQAIENDKKFKAKPGSRCASCLCAFACDRKASKIKTIGKVKNAQKVAEDILAIEAQLESKKEMLKTWIQDNGEVSINGEKFSFYPLESMKADTKELASALMNNNIEPWDYLKGDTKEIKKLCRENPQVADSLAQALTFNVSLRFGHKSHD